MSRRMQDESTIREVMYPEIDWQTYNWLKDFNLDTLTGDDKKRYDDFVMKYVRIGGFTMTELDKNNYPVPYHYELVYWHYKDAASPYKAVFQAVYHSEDTGSINDLRSVIFDFDGTAYSTSFNSTGAKQFAPLLYTNAFTISNHKQVGSVTSFKLCFSITQNKYDDTIKIKTNDYPQTATKDLISKLTNGTTYYPASGVVKLGNGDIHHIIGIGGDWNALVVVASSSNSANIGIAKQSPLYKYFNSDQSVASNNADRLIDWNEVCCAVNSF